MGLPQFLYNEKAKLDSPVVSAQERQSFGYGSKSARLGRESFLNFDSCVLCLQRARPPVKVCDTGHIYCNVG